jgi:hypothetical protein
VKIPSYYKQLKREEEEILKNNFDYNGQVQFQETHTVDSLIYNIASTKMSSEARKKQKKALLYSSIYSAQRSKSGPSV